MVLKHIVITKCQNFDVLGVKILTILAIEYHNVGCYNVVIMFLYLVISNSYKVFETFGTGYAMSVGKNKQ